MKISELQEIEYKLPTFKPCEFGDFKDCLSSKSYDADLTASIDNDDIDYLKSLAKQFNKEMDILSHKILGLVIRFVD